MHETVRITNHSGVSKERYAHAAGILRRHGSLLDVLNWCQAHAEGRDLAEVVVQDEFTHDIVLELGQGVFAVYDAT